MNTDDLVLKIILIGDSGVGKSCILKAFMGDAFKAAYTSTIGVDFEIKPIHIDGQLVNLHLWDTAGKLHPLSTYY
jgi:Ras-related protein Rab-8A